MGPLGRAAKEPVGGKEEVVKVNTVGVDPSDDGGVHGAEGPGAVVELPIRLEDEAGGAGGFDFDDEVALAVLLREHLRDARR